MAQKLIVEGNDAIALSKLCELKKMRPPKGYHLPDTFKKEFVLKAGGFDEALKLLALTIKQSNVTNIGIIVDADNVGAYARWQSIRAVLSKTYNESTLKKADDQNGAKIIQEENLPTIGVWVMPDNIQNGYLEHFIASLVPSENVLWSFVESTVKDLETKPFNELTAAKRGKALLHTWLAWKKDPGKPFGQALDAGYFDVNAPTVQPFLDWFSATFELS